MIKLNKMETLIEIRSSWYGTKFVICPVCKNRAGYYSYFDSNKKISFRDSKHVGWFYFFIAPSILEVDYG